MKPIEPSPDGTPPLPFLTSAPEPADDVFEADPFFNPPDSPSPGTDELVSDEIPFDPDPPLVHAPAVTTTAEERLLETIVSPSDATDDPRVQDVTTEQETLARQELDRASQALRQAETVRAQIQQELRAVKTRCAALEAELTGARTALNEAHQARTETEARFEQAEKQWTEKLSQLRHMLDEVEDARDDVFQKRVPKLLFIGTLIAGIIATLFAYLIGAGQSSPPPAPTAESLPAPAAMAPIPRPVENVTAPLEPASLTPAPAPVLMPEPPANPTPPPAPLLKVPTIEATPPATPPRPKPAGRAPGKTVAWPALSGSHWDTMSSAKELKVVFHYGIFTRGTELSSTARQDLNTIAASLKGQPFKVEVEGHTDSTHVAKAKGNGKDNQAIGLARAKAAARYLIDSCGLPASMVSTSSAGETHPPYPNTSEANQQKNRTVVLKISAR
ncbi:MAG: OmpA family protein [bacterium]